MWLVMRLRKWEAVEVEGLGQTFPMKAPDDHSIGFLQVFATFDDATEAADGGKYGVVEIKEAVQQPNPTVDYSALPEGFYAATNCDQVAAGETFYFRVHDHPELGPVVWGFSVYRRERGYRTLGRQLAGWLALPANTNILIVPDCDRVKHPKGGHGKH